MPSSILANVNVTWKTPYSAEVWEKLESIARIEEENYLSLGPTLPDEQDPRTAVVVVHCPEDEAQFHWVFNVQAAPSDEPPPRVKENDKKLGGRSGLASLLAQSLPLAAPAVGGFQAHLFLLETEFTCPMIPAAIELGSVHDAALLLGRGARLEQIGYRFEVAVLGGSRRSC